MVSMKKIPGNILSVEKQHSWLLGNFRSCDLARGPVVSTGGSCDMSRDIGHYGKFM